MKPQPLSAGLQIYNIMSERYNFPAKPISSSDQNSCRSATSTI